MVWLIDEGSQLWQTFPVVGGKTVFTILSGSTDMQLSKERECLEVLGRSTMGEEGKGKEGNALRSYVESCQGAHPAQQC